MNFLCLLSRTKGQAMLLYVSTLVGLVFGVLSSIINTHFLDPVDYGDVRFVQNIIQFIASLLLFGYFLSGSRILALSNDKGYSQRVKGCMVSILCITIVVLMLACYILYICYLNKPGVAYLFLVSIIVCANPIIQNYINTTAQGDNQIGRISAIRLLPPLFYIPLAYIVYSQIGATSSRMVLLQWGVYTFIGVCVVVSTKPKFNDLKPIWETLKLENKNYGLQLYIGSLVMVTTNYLAGITLGFFGSDNREVGFFTLALTITSPLAMLPGIIGTTYFKSFSTQSRIPAKLMRYTLLMTIISCVLFLIVIKPVVSILYNESYSIVGVYASWLAIGYSIHGLGDMINRFLGSHGRGKEIRNSSIFNGIMKIVGYIVLIYYWGTMGAIITTLCCSFIYTTSLCYYYYKIVKNGNREIA